MRVSLACDGGGGGGEVGEWVWHRVDDEVAYLVNSKFGTVERCQVPPAEYFYFRCYIVASPDMTIDEMKAMNIEQVNNN